MSGADMMELFGHDIMREFGAIAFAAQVREVKMAQIGGHDLRDGFGGGFVREMAVVAKNSLLEAPRTARAILKHLHVVIGFEHEDVRGARAFNDQFCRMAEIGDEPDVAGGGVQQITDGILGIVRNGEGVHQ